MWYALLENGEPIEVIWWDSAPSFTLFTSQLLKDCKYEIYEASLNLKKLVKFLI